MRRLTSRLFVLQLSVFQLCAFQLFSICILLSLTRPAALAQDLDEITISGRVADERGASIVGAKVCQRTSNAAHVSRALVLDPNVRARLQFLPNVLGPVVFENQQGLAVPPPGSNGSGRNIFRGPNYWNVDLGIVKMFDITERFRLRFRTEMFNAFNHPNFDNPRSASVGSPTLGSSQFGRTCCTTVAPNTATNVIQTGESARIIQFGLKLQF